MSNQLKVHRAKPPGFLGLTPKEAKILRDRFGLSQEGQPGDVGDQPDDVDEQALRALARKLATIKKKR